MKFVVNWFIRHFYAFLYFFGLTGILSTILVIPLPQKFNILTQLPLSLIVVSIILVGVGVWGVKRRSDTKSQFFKAMSTVTLIPGILSIFVALFGTSLFYWGIVRLDIQYTKELLDITLSSMVVGIWILSIIYLGLGMFFWFLSKK